MNFNMFFKNYSLILQSLGLNVFLKEKTSYLQNELNELKEKFDNIEKEKIYFEKENEKLKKINK